MSRISFRLLVFVLSLSAALGVAINPASAMTVSSTGESGCSLRVVINAVAANDSATGCGAVVSGGTTPINLPANTITPFDGQIVVPAGVNIQINGDNVNNPLTTVIDGTGATVGRIFEIKSGAAVKLSGLTVTGGQAFDGGAPTGPFASYSGDNGGGILNQGSLTLDHVVLKDNRAGDGGNGWNGGLEQTGGGAGWGGNGGGIYNADYASLTITNSEISGNVAGEGGDGGDGGAGVNELGHNPSGRDGGQGGRGGSGGGIYNSNYGSLSIDRTTIKGNYSGRGGNGGAGHQGAGGNGTFSSGGTGGYGGNGGDNGRAYCRGCSNTYTDQALGGGGIYNVGSATITNSTVSGNGTGAGGNGGPAGPGGQDNGSSTFRSSGTPGFGGGAGRGGGLLNASWQQGSMTLTNVTITGNVTGVGGTGGGGYNGSSGSGGGPGGFGGEGGGIWAQGAHNNATSLTHVTIVKNFVGTGGSGGGGLSAGTAGGRGTGAGIAVGNRYNPSGYGVYVKNTLISANGLPGDPYYDKNCWQYQPIANYQEFYDFGHNLSYPNDGSPCPGLTNVDPDLNLPGNYGGPTETIVPQPGSAAIGGVPLASCSLTTDQRGFPRPGDDGASCDIGAVETGTGPATTPTTMVLVSSVQPSNVGQQVTFTATVSPPPSSGTTSFTDNGSTISGCAATALTSGGQFTCSTTFNSPGDHSISASYTGNSLFGASSNSITQTVGSAPPADTTPPDTVIDSGPSGTIATDSATFSFHGTEGDTASIQCQIDSGGYSDCTSPKTWASLADGTHTADFRAVDAAGNVDPTPATRVFDTAVYRPPPRKAKISKVTVTGPSGTRKGRKPEFTIKVTNGGDAAATGVSLKVTGGGASASKTVGGIPAGSSKVVKMQIKLSRVGRQVLTFKATSADGGSASATKPVAVRKPPRRRQHR